VLPCANLDLSRVDSPAYVIDLAALEQNLQTLAHAQAAAGCTILLALKGFATWATFPLVGKYLNGVAASGPDEARLGKEELGKQVHTYCPAFDERSLRDSIRYSDHVVFNSPSQLDRFRAIIEDLLRRAKAPVAVAEPDRKRIVCAVSRGQVGVTVTVVPKAV